jgi:hypothetical protein
LLPWPTKVGAPVTGRIGYDHYIRRPGSVPELRL